MLVLVTTVASCVYLYSTSYLLEDPFFVRFSVYMLLFVFAMLFTVTSSNFVQLFFGWEFVGLVSYLLVGFWFTRLQANKAAIKAVLFNKIGDLAFLLAIASCFTAIQSTDFAILFSVIPHLVCTNQILLLQWLAFLLFLAAVGKSAQLGLHSWLPDAMQGPTPVSALIHSSTIVTAGVFLLLRCSFFFEYVGSVLILITFVGSLTAFFAATIGTVQNDIKATIAYSTASQLGYLTLIVGLSQYKVALFHLVTHGFFKALLFLGAGSVIHGLSDEQNVSLAGGLAKVLPVTYTCILVASLSLCGMPFLSGFYSKDAILEVAAANYTVSGTFALWLALSAAYCTSFYSCRLLMLVFWLPARGRKIVYESVHESNFVMLLPIAVLCLLSIFGGFIIKDLIIGLGSSFLEGSVMMLYYDTSTAAEFLPSYVKLLPLFFSAVGALFSFTLFYIFRVWLFYFKTCWSIGLLIYRFLSSQWFYDVLINRFFLFPLLRFGHSISFVLFDKGVIELIGPMGFSNSVVFLSKKIQQLHTGVLYHVVLSMIFGTIWFLGFFLLSLKVYFIKGFLVIFITGLF